MLFSTCYIICAILGCLVGAVLGGGGHLALTGTGRAPSNAEPDGLAMWLGAIGSGGLTLFLTYQVEWLTYSVGCVALAVIAGFCLYRLYQQAAVLSKYVVPLTKAVGSIHVQVD